MEEIGFETLNSISSFSNHLRGKERVDFLYVHGDTADRVLSGATVRNSTAGIPLPVARPEHLAMMKFLAVKNEQRRDRQDLPDLAFLMSLPGINRAEGLPDFERDMPLTPEAIEAMREARLHPPVLTWEEYIQAVDELNEQWPPYRDVPSWDEPFEI